MRERLIDLPTIVIGNGRADVGLIVKAMKAGAHDWLEAPFGETELLAAVASALAGVRDVVSVAITAELARRRIADMTSRERDVLLGLLAGETNKVIARRLGISPRTVELHRAGVMQQLGVRTLPEAVRLAISAGFTP